MHSTLLNSLNITANLVATTAHPSLPAIYGGQVIAQALVAGQRSVGSDRPAHSLHAYFLRPGDPEADIRFHVDPVRDGGSFSTRHVSALQQGKVILSASCSFQRPGEGPGFVAPEPQPALNPETLESQTSFWQRVREQHPELPFEEWELHRDWDIRLDDWDTTLDIRELPAQRQAWFRFKSPLDGHYLSEGFQRALLAYISDYMLLCASFLPHPIRIYTNDHQVASLDHGLWFHRSHDMRQWLRYEINCEWTGEGRGLSSGRFYNQHGELIASSRQESLLRPLNKPAA